MLSVTAFMPMATWTMRVKTYNFFSLDIDAERRSSHFALQAPE
jgi:hypothetical protein